MNVIMYVFKWAETTHGCGSLFQIADMGLGHAVVQSEEWVFMVIFGSLKPLRSNAFEFKKEIWERVTSFLGRSHTKLTTSELVC